MKVKCLFLLFFLKKLNVFWPGPARPLLNTAVMADVAAVELVMSNDTTNGTCAERLGCDNCTSSSSCVWCESDSKCLDGHWYGPDGEIITGCSDWRWKQCSGMAFIAIWCR